MLTSYFSRASNHVWMSSTGFSRNDNWDCWHVAMCVVWSGHSKASQTNSDARWAAIAGMESQVQQCASQPSLSHWQRALAHAFLIHSDSYLARKLWTPPNLLINTPLVHWRLTKMIVVTKTQRFDRGRRFEGTNLVRVGRHAGGSKVSRKGFRSGRKLKGVISAFLVSRDPQRSWPNTPFWILADLMRQNLIWSANLRIDPLICGLIR